MKKMITLVTTRSDNLLPEFQPVTDKAKKYPTASVEIYLDDKNPNKAIVEIYADVGKRFFYHMDSAKKRTPKWYHKYTDKLGRAYRTVMYKLVVLHPNRTALKQELIGNCLACSVLKPDSEEYKERYYEAKLLFSILHSTGYKQPVHLVNYAMEDPFQTALDELDHPMKAYRWNIIWPDGFDKPCADMDKARVKLKTEKAKLLSILTLVEGRNSEQVSENGIARRLEELKEQEKKSKIADEQFQKRMKDTVQQAEKLVKP